MGISFSLDCRCTRTNQRIMHLLKGASLTLQSYSACYPIHFSPEKSVKAFNKHKHNIDMNIHTDAYYWIHHPPSMPVNSRIIWEVYSVCINILWTHWCSRQADDIDKVEFIFCTVHISSEKSERIAVPVYCTSMFASPYLLLCWPHRIVMCVV